MLNADEPAWFNWIAGATSPSWVEIPTEQHSPGLRAGRGQSFEQHSSARALAIAAKHDVIPPLSRSARTIKVVAIRRIIKRSSI